jgi:hypothetical protein
MNPLEESPVARKRAYQVFWVVSLLVGAAQVGFAAADATTPTWLKVTLSVLPFVGAAIGYTAQANVTPAPVVAQPDQVFLVEDGVADVGALDRLDGVGRDVDERGAVDTGVLIAVAAILFIICAAVWLFQQF